MEAHSYGSNNAKLIEANDKPPALYPMNQTISVLKTSILLVSALVLIACDHSNSQQEQFIPKKQDIQTSLNALNEQIVQAALTKDFSLISNLYLDSSLLLAEYQPILEGNRKIQEYYEETFRRLPLNKYERQTEEIIELNNFILETGLFQKTLADGTILSGKYICNWLKGVNDRLYLRAECFGYFGEPSNMETHRIMWLTDDSDPLTGSNGKLPPIELQAYNALGENQVRDRDTQGVINAYTADGIYFPYADTAKTGYDELTRHFQAYHKNPVTIDSIEIWTHDFDVVETGIIRYNKFFVRWTLPNGYSGSTSGTGLTYVLRIPNEGLKIHRQIATHTYVPETNE